MNWNKWVRQIRHLLSFAFTVAVIVNIVAVEEGSIASAIAALFMLPSCNSLWYP